MSHLATIQLEVTDLDTAGVFVFTMTCVGAARAAGIAIIDGEFTVKRMIRNASSCKLVAENPDYPPIVITEDSSCEVWGVVTSSIHQF